MLLIFPAISLFQYIFSHPRALRSKPLFESFKTQKPGRMIHLELQCRSPQGWTHKSPLETVRLRVQKVVRLWDKGNSKVPEILNFKRRPGSSWDSCHQRRPLAVIPERAAVVSGHQRLKRRRRGPKTTLHR